MRYCVVWKIQLLPVVTFVCVMATSAPTSAFDVEGLYSEIEKFEPVIEGLEFPPPDRMLEDIDLEWFNENLADGECGAASSALFTEFLKRNDERVERFDFAWAISAWQVLVLPGHYPDVLFCKALASLEEAEAAIAAGDIADLPLSQRSNPEIKGAHPILGRWLNLASLILLAWEDYAPAQLELARRSERELGVRLTPGFAYFILARARQSGHQDPDLGRLFAKAESALSEEKRTEIEPAIKAGAWPREWPVVRD